ncbi:PepSY-associated TM helix domain-containing protein [Microbulbifer thermotolerans]|uniref:PepSY-associated TM helix domain-containing protein n=1 Tax=Microbulbifer thermotolerans TaxID=252514 RepID=UPI00224B80DA|nr:PepSY-associated TM helix domain-containing protein [Microbulbifer thermotolerans]MCX2834902.1 PepSY domain-containing protein [Microbulbifer thermotolerans]WKT61275.1 PepSY-associated TM helix domain-containing protein [Microbulbifer thermotolerans]
MNKILFKLHSWMALAAFLPLLVICVSGSILVFKHEIDTLLMAEKVRVDTDAGERLSLDRLLANVNQSFPDYEVVGWHLFQDPGRADQVYLIQRGSSEWSYALLNQYSGAILAEPRGLTHYFTDWLLDLHYTLLLDDPGLLLTSIFSVLLCLLGITGLILHRRFWKNFFTLRWKSRLIVYFSDLHKMVGVIASPVLLIVGFTGAWWNISHFAHEIAEHADGAEHHVMQSRLYSDDLSLQALQDAAQQQVQGFEATYISLPWEPGVNITFWGDVHTDNPLLSQYASSVTYDANSGELIGAFDIREAGVGAKIIDSYRRLHFGDFAGLASRVLWCVIGLTPLLLAVTGGYIWYRRREKRHNARMKRRNKRLQELVA